MPFTVVNSLAALHQSSVLLSRFAPLGSSRDFRSVEMFSGTTITVRFREFSLIVIKARVQLRILRLQRIGLLPSSAARQRANSTSVTRPHHVDM